MAYSRPFNITVQPQIFSHWKVLKSFTSITFSRFSGTREINYAQILMELQYIII